MLKRTAPLMLLALFGCGETDPTDSGDTADTADTGEIETVGSPELDTLVWEGGCGDILMYAGAEDRSLILVATAENLSEQSYNADAAPVSATYDLAVHPERLQLVQGHDVFDLYCNDVLDDEVVETTWTPISGQITVTATSTGEKTDYGAYYGNAVIVVEDVTLQADGAKDVTIESMSWEAFIGWLPG